MNLGGAELIILVAIAVLVFGAGWLPKAAKNLGKAKVELDEAQRQFHEAKNSVVEATGVKELESTVRKANKVINTSPQKLMKDAAKNAVTGSGSTAAAGAAKEASVDGDDGIEDAEIVDTKPVDTKTSGDDGDTNVNVDFSS